MEVLSLDAPVIRRVAPGETAEALCLVFAGLPADQVGDYVQTLMADTRIGVLGADGLIEARRGVERVGAAWFQILAGRSALVWPPRRVAGEPMETARRLMAAGCGLMACSDVSIANAILSTVTAEDDAVLCAAGFSPLASLLYMASESTAFPEERPAGPLTFESWSPAKEDRFARLVQATYLGTLDCPAMNYLRRAEDVLAGYRAAGAFSPDQWLFVRFEGRDAGCLLLADHPAADNMELAYMGLVPASRGNGFGRDLCRYAQWLTRRAGRARLVAAVDSANLPAIEMYASAGFRAWDRRVVYLKSFQS